MKKDTWIIYAIIAITSTTTVLTMSDGTLFGFLRGVGFAVLLDGMIIFWESRGAELKDAQQRKWSNGMKWAGVGMLFAIGITWAATLLVPVDAVKNVDLFGMVFSTTVREAIHWGVVAAISGWVVLTLAVVLYLREIDPDNKRELDRKRTVDAAEKARADKEDEAFTTAMNAISEVVGVERGILALEKRLKEFTEYTEFERQQLVSVARAKVIENKTGSKRVDTANIFQTAVKDETASFPNPSTPKN